MSLNPRPMDPVPQETAWVARAAFPKGNRYMTMRDELGVLYPNDLFADLYPQVGHYGEPPWRLVLVTLMQFSENLTDRQAADAVRSLNRLEIVGETLHYALNTLTQLMPEWLKEQVTAEWFVHYGKRFSDYQQPKGKSERQELAGTIGRDGLHLLTAIYQSSAPASLRSEPAVAVLRQVWVQHFYQEGGKLTWRQIKDCPPSSVMLASPYDLDSRYSEKRNQSWRGYKVHLTETCDDDTPHLITHTVVDSIHQALAQRELLPEVHLVDGAYTSGEKLVSSQRDYQIDLMGPMRQDQSWQAHDEQAYDISHFHIDWDQEQVICPMGQPSRYWKPAKGPRGKATIQVIFAKKTCLGCESRSRCTRSKTGPRELTLHPKEQHQALQAAPERQQSQDFKQRYKRRVGIEGTMSQAAFSLGMRRTRYRGLQKTHFHHIATAIAINLQRFVDWIWETPRSKTRLSHFARLEGVT